MALASRHRRQSEPRRRAAVVVRSAADATPAAHEAAKFLSELALADYAMLRYPPSHAAAAAVLVAREIGGLDPAWTPTLEHYAGRPECELAECARAIRGLVVRAARDRDFLPGIRQIIDHWKVKETADRIVAEAEKHG